MDRRSFINLAKTAAIAAPVAAVSSHFSRPDAAKIAKDATERVLDTGKMRCGYVIYDPCITKDPNTGKLSGIFYDLTQKIGELADIEIEWESEGNFNTISTDFQTDKYDVFTGLWPDARRAKVIDFSGPVFYSGLGVYVRADDHRFGGDLSKLNAPHVRFATIDAEMSQIVQQSDFPHVSVLDLPDNSDISMLIESIVTRKADAAIVEKVIANQYMLHNPGALRNLADARPIRIFENTWSFAHALPRLKTILNVAIKEMLYSGYVDQVLAKYERVPDSFYRMRLPIQ